jgi:lipopolysaccharide biosynthesis regulator YciM
MKVVHNSTKADEPMGETIADWLAKGLEWEKAGEVDRAVKAYERVIKKDPLREQAYDRLMIIYRKQKEYKKELAIIKAGIAAFDKFYATAVKTSRDKKVISISRALLKSTGLADKKGKPLFQREPIGKWAKRADLVKKRIMRGRET